VPAEIEPAALALLVDFSERPRVEDWSLRAALVRYAQPEPQRVNDLLDVVRRTEWALGAHAATIARDGPDLWAVLEGGRVAKEPDARLVGILHAARELDRLGDVLSHWAVARTDGGLDEEVDRVIEHVGRRLDALGVPHQERPPGPRDRGV
jgi:hypothetical protein